MSKWYVTVFFDASKTVEVEAESEKEAKDKAMEAVGRVCLCHQCAGEIDVEDPIEALKAWQ